MWNEKWKKRAREQKKMKREKKNSDPDIKTLLMCSLRSLTSGACASDFGRCTAGPEKVLQLTRVHSVGKKWTWTLRILWATSGQLCADFWLPPRSPNPPPINYVTALIAGLVDAGAEIEMASGVKDRNLVSNRTRHVNKSTSRFVFFCWRKVPCEMHCMIWINGFITMKVPLFLFLPPPPEPPTLPVLFWPWHSLSSVLRFIGNVITQVTGHRPSSPVGSHFEAFSLSPFLHIRVLSEV